METPLTEHRLQLLSRGAGVVLIFLGLAGVLGWVLDIAVLKSVLPGLATMKMNTAISFVLVGIALWLQIDPAAPPGKIWIGRACAFLAMAVGVATLTEYISGVDLGIDQILIHSPLGERNTSSPGRMAPNTALCFALTGAALVTLATRTCALRLVPQVLAIAALLVAFLATTGYAFNVTALYGVAGYASMAIQTMAGFTVLSIGILLSRPQRGVIAILAQDNPAGAAVRRLLPLIVATLFAVAWARLKGQHAGFYGTEFGVALLVTVSTSIIVSLSLWNARNQGASDRAQQQALRDERFMFELGDLLRTSSESSEALFQVSCNLGRYLEGSRCLFMEIDAASAQAIVRRDHHDGVRSMAGSRPLSSYASDSVAAARAGRTIVNNDASTDERTAEYYEATYRPADLRAYVAVPLLRSARWVSTLLVSTHLPRAWQAREVTLIQSVAERTWLWFEHLVALEDLRRREQDLAVTMNSIGDAIITTDSDRRVVRMNPVAEQLTGWKLSEAVTRPLHDVFRSLDEDTRSPADSSVEHVFRDGHVRGAGKHTTLVARDGSELAIADKAALIRDPDGTIRGAVLVFRDVGDDRAAARVLKASEARKSAVLDSAFDAIVSMDHTGVILEFNRAAENVFGHRRERAIGMQMADLLVPESHREGHRSGLARYLKTREASILGKVIVLPAMRADGSQLTAEMAITCIRDQEPPEFTAFVRDISERKRAEQEREQLLAQLGALNTELEERVRGRTAQLTATLKEREVLLQEVHHRVKNNLQVISSLINMQIRKLVDKASRSGLEECRTRVEAIALIHEKLYQSRDYARVPFSEYATSLACNIFHATGISPANITLDVDVEAIALTVDKAIPCGLILNELITNALKHAFPNDRPGSLRIQLRQTTAGDIVLVVSDDGVGTARDIDPSTSKTLGLQLISTLVEQLDGRLEVIRQDGMTFRVTFPLDLDGTVPVAIGGAP